jgi:cell filamentation protein
MVLGNKLQLTSQVELNRAEEKLSKQKAKQLFESGDIDHVQRWAPSPGWPISMPISLSEVYAFAGQVRDVNLAKGHFPVCTGHVFAAVAGAHQRHAAAEF